MGELKVISGNKKHEQNSQINNASDVHKAMRFLEDEDREKLYVLCLNAKNFITHTELITIGTLTTSLIHPREVFRAAIKNSGASIICVHNHPSGDSEPSQNDLENSIRLVNAGEIIGIKVLDHVIIGKDCYFSMAENNTAGFNQQGSTELTAQKCKEHLDEKEEKTVEKKRNEAFTKLNNNQLDEINWKLNIAISTLDMFGVYNPDEIPLRDRDSLNTLASEALDRLEEVRGMLNQDV